MNGEERFAGAWQVFETCFAADGTKLGHVQQTRRVLPGDGPDQFVVAQNCQPSPELLGHALGRFAGDFIFSLQKKAQYRLYQGPDVIGHATAFGERFVLGEGVWPRFGYHFHSWSMSLSAERQLTGGCFYRGREVVAVIFGLGQLQAKHIPELRAWQGQTASGRRWIWDARTEEVREEALQRVASSSGAWIEWNGASEESFHWELERGEGSVQHGSPLALGFAKVYGPHVIWESCAPEGISYRGYEIIDPWTHDQYALRQVFRLGRLERLEAIHLQS